MEFPWIQAEGKKMSQELSRRYIEHITDVLSRIPPEKEELRLHYRKLLEDELEKTRTLSDEDKKRLKNGMNILRDKLREDNFNPSER